MSVSAAQRKIPNSGCVSADVPCYRTRRGRRRRSTRRAPRRTTAPAPRPAARCRPGCRRSLAAAATAARPRRVASPPPAVAAPPCGRTSRRTARTAGARAHGRRQRRCGVCARGRARTVAPAAPHAARAQAPACSLTRARACAGRVLQATEQPRRWHAAAGGEGARKRRRGDDVVRLRCVLRPLALLRCRGARIDRQPHITAAVMTQATSSAYTLCARLPSTPCFPARTPKHAPLRPRSTCASPRRRGPAAAPCGWPRRCRRGARCGSAGRGAPPFRA
jgi:hypothetical protein